MIPHPQPGDAMKAETCWMPWSRKDGLIYGWATGSRHSLRAHLDCEWVSWNEAKIKLVKVTIRKVRPQKKKPSTPPRRPAHGK
jgi:hypothetical protein